MRAIATIAILCLALVGCTEEQPAETTVTTPPEVDQATYIREVTGSLDGARIQKEETTN